MAKKANTEVVQSLLDTPKEGLQESNISTSTQEVIKSLQDAVENLTLENDSLKGQHNHANSLVCNEHTLIDNLETKVKELTAALEESSAVIKSQANHIENLLLTTTTIIEPKDTVIAVRNGVERQFPRLAWDAIGADKGGWQIKVETPEEAK